MGSRGPRRPSHATIVAYVALVVALGGTSAYAINEYDSSNIKDDTLLSADIKDATLKSVDVGADTLTRDDLAPASVTSSEINDGSVFTAEIAPSTILSSDVKDGALTGADILNGSLTGGDVLDGSLAGADVLNNSLGGDDIDESALIGVNADALDGADSSDYSRGVARTFHEGGPIPAGSFATAQAPLAYVRYTCPSAPTTQQGTITITSRVSGLAILIDDGSENPWRRGPLDPNQIVTHGALANGEHLTIALMQDMPASPSVPLPHLRGMTIELWSMGVAAPSGDFCRLFAQGALTAYEASQLG